MGSTFRYLAIDEEAESVPAWFRGLADPPEEFSRERRNFDSEIYAVPKAAAALARGQYFVADDDGAAMLDRVCQALRLRGVQCAG